jgi:hypothetical protein
MISNHWQAKIVHLFDEPAWERRHPAGEYLNPTTPSAGRMPALPGFIVPLRGFQTVKAFLEPRHSGGSAERR